MRLNNFGGSQPLSTEEAALNILVPVGDMKDSISLIGVQDGTDVRMARKLDTSYDLWALLE